MRNALRFAAVAVTALLSAACAKTGDAVAPSEVSPETAPSSLVGPTWRLVSLEGRPALPGTRVTAVFGADDRVAGSAGCNGYFGRAAATGARLDVGLLGATLMHCAADGVMAQEKAYLDALQKAAAYRVVGSQLRLGPAADVVTLVFAAE